MTAPIYKITTDMTNFQYGLGRFPSEPDPKNEAYLAEKVLPLDMDIDRQLKSLDTKPAWLPGPLAGLFGTNRKGRWWEPGPTLDQKQTPRCVAYSGYQCLASQPLSLSQSVIPPTYVIYREAQSRDPWASEPHDGSTVHAASKALKDVGLIKNYVWLDTVDSKTDPMVRLAAYVLQYGPAWIGSDWYNNMFFPDKNNYIHPGGTLAGGHAYLCIGYNGANDSFEFINSWGRRFARGGIFYMKGTEFAPLLKNGGEAVGLIR